MEMDTNLTSHSAALHGTFTLRLRRFYPTPVIVVEAHLLERLQIS